MRDCARCKGKGLCGLPRCPVIARFEAIQAPKPVSSYSGDAPSVFVGSSGYPRVSGGPLLTAEGDHPPDWLARGLGIEDIVGVRARTIRGSAPVARVADAVQEIALAPRPVGVEAAFARPVTMGLSFDGIITPVGQSGELSELMVTGSVPGERVVERVCGDTDLRATEACMALYRDGVDPYRITTLLSSGLIGVRRRFVPTRWAITAVDDTIGSQLRAAIARFPPLDGFRVVSGGLFGNTIAAILAPGPWQFEMIEIWEGQSLWAGDEACVVTDREGSKKSGYSPITGAYYSARLAAAEYLSRERKSARIILVRQVSGDYWAPLGTWVVREATRRAFQGVAVSCPGAGEAAAEVTRQLGAPLWAGKSRLLREFSDQRTLSDFFRR